ncbi:MAG: hypothetical protein JWQ84_2362 [Mucilaginibacter sp.]|nr:hypothetical protein [Mucilaginibacter sp.]
MSKFNKTNLISIFSTLGQQLLHPDEQFLAVINTEYQYNAWFTPENVLNAVTNLGKMLNPLDLTTWLDRYNLDENKSGKKIGLILAGNIPLVGFHDVLCVLATGNIALIKSSSNDARLIKHVLHLLVTIEPHFVDQFSFIERLKDFDAVIATGSNNTSRYFEYYFGKVPHIIRKNRSSIALLTGAETGEQITELGHDIFDFYGLGCRNVSKLLLPKEYDFHLFYEPLETYQEVINHHKYSNNYSYNRSIYLVNSDKHLDNGFLLLKEDKKLASPLAVLYYEYYDNLQSAQNLLNEESDNIQCIVSGVPLAVKNQLVGFGMSQQPALWDYADGVDTMAFLSAIND